MDNAFRLIEPLLVWIALGLDPRLWIVFDEVLFGSDI